MDSKVVKIGTARPRVRTYYERFMEKEGVPIVDGYGVTDVRNVSLKPWKRLGCDGAYLQMRGLEGITGVCVGKLAAGASTHPERHLYEKIFYILQGTGVAEIQQRDRVPQNFQWSAGSLFAPAKCLGERIAEQFCGEVIPLGLAQVPLDAPLSGSLGARV